LFKFDSTGMPVVENDKVELLLFDSWISSTSKKGIG